MEESRVLQDRQTHSEREAAVAGSSKSEPKAACIRRESRSDTGAIPAGATHLLWQTHPCEGGLASSIYGFLLEQWTLPSDIAYQLWKNGELYRIFNCIKKAEQRWQAAANQAGSESQKQLAYEEYVAANRELHQLAQRIHYGRHTHAKED